MTKVTKSDIAKIDMAESILKALITELGPKNFAVALGNSNSHGAAFIKAGYEGALKNNDVLLNKWHDAVAQMVLVGEQLENM
jgi:hypothetical protein